MPAVRPKADPPGIVSGQRPVTVRFGLRPHAPQHRELPLFTLLADVFLGLFSASHQAATGRG